jgi:hypothetical protein
LRDPWLAQAQAIAALAPKLSDPILSKAARTSAAWLGWASNEGKSTEWAKALAALSTRTTEVDAIRQLAGAIAYPMAAGPATEILLDSIRARDPSMPANEVGSRRILEWLAKKYPELVRPVCPDPPQIYKYSALRCP